MATARCQGCGEDLPGGAAFCPRCGLGVGQIPILGLVDDPADPRATEATADGGARARAARTLVAVVLAVAVLLVVLAALGSSRLSGG